MGKPQRKRKRRTHAPDENIVGSLDPSKKGIPRALVLRTGKHTKVVKKLERDLKLCMRPHTADKLKQKKENVMKDFLNVVGPLGISHFLVLSATERCQYLKVAKTPQGPTATFRIDKWSSSADFAAAMKHYTAPAGAFKFPPLLVLSGFKHADRHGKLCASLFQVRALPLSSLLPPRTETTPCHAKRASSSDPTPLLSSSRRNRTCFPLWKSTSSR